MTAPKEWIQKAIDAYSDAGTHAGGDSQARTYKRTARHIGEGYTGKGYKGLIYRHAGGARRRSGDKTVSVWVTRVRATYQSFLFRLSEWTTTAFAKPASVPHPSIP